MSAEVISSASHAATRRTPGDVSRPPKEVPALEIERYTLSNGLEVILHENHTTPIVAVNTWYHVGSGDEQPGRTGFAHLFEHIMFMGSAHVPTGGFDRHLELAGATNNGSTTEDRTNYHETLPSNALALALWLDSDRMGYLLPALDQATLDLQRDVVKNERRQRVDNMPYGRADETILAMLYPSGHPYSWPVIGSMEDLSAATLDDVHQFFKKYYAPNNATLTIAGAFLRDEAKTLVERYFGDIPRGPVLPPRPNPAPVVLPSDIYTVLEDRVQLPQITYTWPTVRSFTSDDAALSVLGSILADGKNSRLYKTLVYDLQIAQSVHAYQYGSRLAGLFQIVVTPQPGQLPEAVDRLVRATVAEVVHDGITARELARVQNSVRSAYLSQLSSIERVADMLNHYNYFVGTPDYVQYDAARFDAVTCEDVRRVAEVYLSRPKVVLTVVPEGERALMVTGADVDVGAGA